MTHLLLSALLALSTLGPTAAAGAPAAAATPVATVGAPAPDFALKDLDGKEVRLSAYKGKTVVLEWFNPGCPFVVYAHGEGPLKAQPAKALADGVVWLAVNSGAPGKQGHGVEANKKAVQDWGIGYPVLQDEAGQVGRLYGATTTPNLFVVDPKGNLAYAGALDDAPLGKSEGAVTNHVTAALADIAAGRAVAKPSTKAYGCSVKYGS
jgi:peroxiredoxin